MTEEAGIHSSVQAFYAEKRDPNANSKTLCSLKVPIARSVCRARSATHPQLQQESFGCGLPFPGAVDGCKVLDLGSGPGLDVFTLSQLVGKNGSVTGVDMTPRMLERAEAMVPWHREKFGYSNVDFKLGTLEELDKVDGLQPDSFDVVISNCVICLTRDKRQVLAHAFRLLKPGGEICYSDIFALGEKLPEDVRQDSVVWNEGFGGASTWEELAEWMQGIGYLPPLRIAQSEYLATDDRLQGIIGDRKFASMTIRAVKPDPGNTSALPASLCYKGTLADYPEQFDLSVDLSFPKGQAVAVDESVAKFLMHSRFAEQFEAA